MTNYTKWGCTKAIGMSFLTSGESGVLVCNEHTPAHKPKSPLHELESPAHKLNTPIEKLKSALHGLKPSHS